MQEEPLFFGGQLAQPGVLAPVPSPAHHVWWRFEHLAPADGLCEALEAAARLAPRQHAVLTRWLNG